MTNIKYNDPKIKRPVANAILRDIKAICRERHLQLTEKDSVLVNFILDCWNKDNLNDQEIWDKVVKTYAKRILL